MKWGHCTTQSRQKKSFVLRIYYTLEEKRALIWYSRFFPTNMSIIRIFENCIRLCNFSQKFTRNFFPKSCFLPANQRMPGCSESYGLVSVIFLSGFHFLSQENSRQQCYIMFLWGCEWYSSRYCVLLTSWC